MIPVRFFVPEMSDKTPNELATLDEIPDPCPTPLAWQEVVQSFQEQIRQGPLDFQFGTVTATQFGEGPPLVFLPGSLGSPRLYALLAWLLKENRQCWLLDHPVFESRPNPKELISATATAYVDVLGELFDGPVEVYASNFGVPVCLEMMRSTPTLVQKAALQSGWATRKLTFFEKSLLQIGRFVPFTIRSVPLWLSTQIQNHRAWFPPFDETRFGFLLNETYQTSVRDVSRRLLAASQTDLSSQLAKIRTEVLLVRCEGDGQLISQQQDLLEKSLPKHESVSLHTTGHYPFLTHPHRLVKVLREFFNIPKPVV